ncbi:hypothetical protein [Paenibacillus hubeiensis]|uniref:hypothetical protein n=2 Tax=Paenibacillus TaxID=44249 RepID=UPI0031BB2C3C
MQVINGKYILSEDEFHQFETFMQYGNLRDAKYVFVGMEEGLWRFNYDENLEGRLDFLSQHHEFVHYVDEKHGYEGGWYVTDTHSAPALLTAINGSLKKRGRPESWELDRKIDQTMRMQIRLAALLEANLDFSVLKYFTKNDDYSTYPLHKRDGETAMFDWYPLPKKSKTDFPYVVSGKFENSREYYNYYDNHATNRKQLIRNLYDHYPMNISIIYVGKDRGQFKLLKHYEDLGFEFHEYSTGTIPSGLDLQPGNKPKMFMIGRRTRVDGHLQLAVMTPFLGMGQCSFDDINVIAAWLHLEQKKGAKKGGIS